MKKPNKKEHLNLLLSAFLILAFIVCANFFSGFTSSMPTMTAQLINIAVYAVFGLLLFYATRVGDGKAVFRFSPLTLLILVLPSVFIIVASLAAFMPLHDVVAADALTGKLSVITSLAAVAVGYGVPYSFVSGFELEGYKADDAEEEAFVKGGVEADVADSDIAAAEEAEEALLQNQDIDAE